MLGDETLCIKSVNCATSYFYHDKECPLYQWGEEEYLNGSIRIDSCRKCVCLVTDFVEHWKAVHINAN
jgi:hypothetical protein